MNHKKSILISLALVGSVAAIMALLLGSASNQSVAVNLVSKSNEPQYQLAFQKFISRYHKNYLTQQEYQARFAIFKKNLDYIQEQKSVNFKITINTFADWSDEERERILQNQIPTPGDEPLLRDYPQVDNLKLP
jgi:hypothetical protein